MRILGIDLETTGLEKTSSEITEIAWTIYDTSKWSKPLVFESHLLTVQNTIPREITELTGIDNVLLAECGEEFPYVFGRLMNQIKKHNVEALVAHNAQFDRGFLEERIRQEGYEVPQWHWIDTKTDIPYPKRIKQRNLITLAAEHGFLNPFPHAAIFDVFTMLKIMSNYDAEKILSSSKEPWVLVKALVDKPNKDLAKERGYSWETWNGQTYKLSWVKAVRASQVEEEKNAARFTVQTIGVLA